MKSITLFAAAAATIGAAIAAVPAAAVTTTYASFSQKNGAPLFRYQRLGDGAGTGNRLYTTASAGGTALAAIPVDFKFMISGGPAELQGFQNALLTFDATTNRVIDADGAARNQAGFSGSLSFQRVTPLFGQTNLLTITFTNAQLRATQGGRAPTFSISVPGGAGTSIVQSSDFVDFGTVVQSDFSLNFTGANPAFNGANGAYGAGFRANGGGSFASNPAPFFGVPEPETWGLMILGFGMVGAAMRRRRAASSVAA